MNGVIFQVTAAYNKVIRMTPDPKDDLSLLLIDPGVECKT
jgi:hypothetical protein